MGGWTGCRNCYEGTLSVMMSTYDYLIDYNRNFIFIRMFHSLSVIEGILNWSPLNINFGNSR
jgi:hypothetical protein